MKRVSILANPERTRELSQIGIDFSKLGLTKLSFEDHLSMKSNLAPIDDLIVVAGGDGSLNFAIKQLDQKSLLDKFSIYYIPMGTANDFSRYFSMDKQSAIKNFKELKFDKNKKLFYAKLDDQVLVNMASCGVFGGLTPEVPEEMKSWLGSFSYYMKALELLSERKSFSMQLVLDGQNFQFDNVLGFLVGNSKFAGGGVNLTKEASPEEKSLDLLLIREEPTLDLIEMAIDFQLDNSWKEDPRIFYKQFQNLKFSSDEKIPISLDGESYEKKDFEIQISEKPWTLLI